MRSEADSKRNTKKGKAFEDKGTEKRNDGQETE